MASYDYDVTMNDRVGIAELKSRLSEHLRRVRSGRTLTILDRDTPIARIVPWKQRDSFLQIRPPVPGAPKLQQVPLPAPLGYEGDIVDLLLDDRQNHR